MHVPTPSHHFRGRNFPTLLPTSPLLLRIGAFYPLTFYYQELSHCPQVRYIFVSTRTGGTVQGHNTEWRQRTQAWCIQPHSTWPLYLQTRTVFTDMNKKTTPLHQTLGGEGCSCHCHCHPYPCGAPLSSYSPYSPTAPLPLPPSDPPPTCCLITQSPPSTPTPTTPSYFSYY